MNLKLIFKGREKMKVDLRFGEDVAIASFTKKQITSCYDIRKMSSMLCMSLSFSGFIDINPENLPDNEIIDKLSSNIRYAIIAILSEDGADVEFGTERALLKEHSISIQHKRK